VLRGRNLGGFDKKNTPKGADCTPTAEDVLKAADLIIMPSNDPSIAALHLFSGR
jgi:hypothetical protein